MDNEKSVITNVVRDLELKLGRRPKVMVTKIGLDGHDRGSRLLAYGEIRMHLRDKLGYGYRLIAA